MARCHSPFRKKGSNIDLPCGKCYECRARRVSGWSFRLMKEEETAVSSFFLTLTYAPEHVPITEKKWMTLDKRHVQLFMKRLRKRHVGPKLIYYACGEYGGHTSRPHYHMILFNAKVEDIEASWQYGSVYYGTVSGASVGYTLKYICKPGKIPMHKNDDRQKEFSLMSKGIGLGYITDAMYNWHHQDELERMYIPLKDGKKIPIPRYLRTKIFTSKEVDRFVEHRKNIEDSPMEVAKFFDPAQSLIADSKIRYLARKNQTHDRQTKF